MASTPDEYTTITVPVTKLQGTHAPQICVKTGQKAQCLVPTFATATPKWAWLLIILGGWPLFVARKWLFAREALDLPARNYVYDQLEWTKKGIAGCFAVAAIAGLYAVATMSPAGIALAWMTAVMATVGWLLLVPRVWVTAELITGDKPSVRLGSVHTEAAFVIERS